MQPGPNLYTPLLLAGAAVALVAVGAFWYMASKAEPEPTPAEAFTPVEIEVGAQVSEAAETPADKIPETNPYSDYKNPFE